MVPYGKLDENARRMIARFPLGFVATVTADGMPRVSPKGTFLVLDADTIAFADIRSPGTLRNLAANPACEVNFIDPFLRKGLRVRGSCEIAEQGSVLFDELHGNWREVWGKLADRARRLVIVHIEAASELTTPPYDDGATEEEMIALYKAKYREIYP